MLVLLPPAVSQVATVTNQRNGRDQAHPLMDFQHVRAFIEQRLLLGISLGLLRWEAQIGQ